jgi:hypothetical protein
VVGLGSGYGICVLNKHTCHILRLGIRLKCPEYAHIVTYSGSGYGIRVLNMQTCSVSRYGIRILNMHTCSGLGYAIVS